MPQVSFLNDSRSVEAETGSTLQLAAKEADSSLPFGCRGGTCGTCILLVVQGLESLEEPGFVEEDTLQVVGGDDPLNRLGCQIIVGDEDLEVSY